MKFAIIAAGEGSRLRSEGVQECKPLVRLENETLVGRLCRIFAQNGASEIVIVTRPEIEEQLRGAELGGGVPVNIIGRLTPSSMHSFAEMAPMLESESFCLTTVDTVFREDEFGSYVAAFRKTKNDCDGLWAVTPFIDDEKPLYIETNGGMITKFGDTQGEARVVSGGIYCMKPRCMPTLYRCLQNGVSRMRNFQRQLISDGRRLGAFEFGKIVDIDHAADIRKAEEFLKG